MNDRYANAMGRTSRAGTSAGRSGRLTSEGVACCVASLSCGRGRLADAVPALQHCDETEAGEGKQRVDRAKERSEFVQQPDLQQSESAPPHDFAVQKPRRRSNAIELEDVQDGKARRRHNLVKRLFTISTVMSEHLVER